MDPIHPIVPLPPNIPPVSPAPTVTRIDREGPRGNAQEEKRRRRRAQPEHGPGASEEGLDYAGDGRDGGDDSRLHIDVTA
jgi:hypothetical protein